MLMAYIKLDHAIRTMQKRGERLFEFGRKKLSGQSEKRDRQAPTRLSRDDSSQMGANANDYSSNRRAD